MSRFTLGSGEEIYYEDTGSGEQTIIMMHGWSSSHETYAACVPEISRKARCITYDHRGHGNSKDANGSDVTMDTLASDLNELIEGLGLSDVTLLGWSMGAGVALNYMEEYGCGALRQTILCDMTPKQLNDESWHLGLYQGKYTKEDMEKEATKSFYGLYKKFAVEAIPRLKKVPGFLLRKPLKKILDACDEQTLKSLAVSMKTKDYREGVGRISVPVRYFYAVPGSLFSPELASWYGEHVHSGYEAVAFEDSTHMLIADQPERFTREVLRALES